MMVLLTNFESMLRVCERVSVFMNIISSLKYHRRHCHHRFRCHSFVARAAAVAVAATAASLSWLAGKVRFNVFLLTVAE